MQQVDGFTAMANFTVNNSRAAFYTHLIGNEKCLLIAVLAMYSLSWHTVFLELSGLCFKVCFELAPVDAGSVMVYTTLDLCLMGTTPLAFGFFE